MLANLDRIAPKRSYPEDLENQEFEHKAGERRSCAGKMLAVSGVKNETINFFQL